jgi:hypothetical protein
MDLKEVLPMSVSDFSTSIQGQVAGPCDPGDEGLFSKMRHISGLAEELVAAREGPCSLKLVDILIS